MQNLIKGFLFGFGSGKGIVSPAASPTAIPAVAGKRPPKKKKKPCDDGIIDMDKCFEVGYKSVQRATTELIQALDKKKLPAHDFDLYTRWNTRIEDMLVNDISEHYPKHK